MASSLYQRGKKCHSCGRGPVHDTSPYVLSIPCLIILLILLYLLAYFLMGKCNGGERSHWQMLSGLVSGTTAAVVVLLVVHAAHYCPF